MIRYGFSHLSKVELGAMQFRMLTSSPCHDLLFIDVDHVTKRIRKWTLFDRVA